MPWTGVRSARDTLSKNLDDNCGFLSRNALRSAKKYLLPGGGDELS